MSELDGVEVVSLDRLSNLAELPSKLAGVDFIFHLAGANRPQDVREFEEVNVHLTQHLCNAVVESSQSSRKKIPILFSSSSQASHSSPYGLSKVAAEEVLMSTSRNHSIPVFIFRLPNVFGKWCKPNYNSVVATFCHNIATDLPIQIHDPNTTLTLVYVDDVITHFIEVMNRSQTEKLESGFFEVEPKYSTTLAKLAQRIYSFKDSRDSLVTEPVGSGFTRALYATYLSYLPLNLFSYPVKQHSDVRGTFVEMLKTPDCGQFSFFTAHPGVTRGGHYHHSKNEKFLVVQGSARFRFKHMQTGQCHELTTHSDRPEIVESIPGWTHDITNIGQNTLIVMLWANEQFDRANPDTIASPL